MKINLSLLDLDLLFECIKMAPASLVVGEFWGPVYVSGVNASDSQSF